MPVDGVDDLCIGWARTTRLPRPVARSVRKLVATGAANEFERIVTLGEDLTAHRVVLDGIKPGPRPAFGVGSGAAGSVEGGGAFPKEGCRSYRPISPRGSVVTSSGPRGLVASRLLDASSSRGGVVRHSGVMTSPHCALSRQSLSSTMASVW